MPDTGGAPIFDSRWDVMRYLKITLGLPAADARELGAWAWDRWVQLGGETNPSGAITTILVEMEAQPVFQAHFPGFTELKESGYGMTVPQYIDYRKRVREAAHAAGIPAGLFDSDQEIADIMLTGQSVTEVEKRIEMAGMAVTATDKEARDALERFYGIGQGDLVAFFLDEQRALPRLEKQYQAAQLAGVSVRTGFGPIKRRSAERLYKIGLTQDEAQKEFSRLVAEQDLYRNTAGEQLSGGDVISRQEQFKTVEGSVGARMRIEKKRRRRTAGFEGGGRVSLGS